MPAVQCQSAATRGQSRAPSLQLMFSLLLLLLGQTRGAIHIPKGYGFNETVKEPPEITRQPHSFTAFHVDDVFLKCEASGNPTPSFRWVKDGVEFGDESSKSGTITGSEEEDLKSYQGKYRCYASNELGTAMSNLIELLIEPTPIFPKQKRLKIVANKGDSVVLPCNPPNSSVVPHIHWMDRKLLHIRQSERVTLGLDGNLYFANVLETDTRDDYTCNAQYVAARTIVPKEPISLSVLSNALEKDRPARLQKPEGKHSYYRALRGESLTLECIPSGLPTPTIAWQSKNGPMSSFTVTNFDRWLRFEEISESDDGEYSCTASNVFGSVTHFFTVTVEAAPYWSKRPPSQIYAPGETVRINCQAEGIPTPEINWKINGVNLADTDDEPRRRVNGGTMIITDVRIGDTAVYQCEASSIHGTSLINVNIYIIELPPQILSEDEQVYRLTEGRSAWLHCKAFGSPRPQISWESESIGPVLSHPKMSQLTNGTLLIINASREETGSYLCSIKHSNESIIAYLEVLNRTKITNPPQDLEVFRGQSGILQCDSVVDLKFLDRFVQWRKNGHKITASWPDDKYKVFENGSLEISNVQQKDTGLYSCDVITSLDLDTASAYVTVVYKPDPPHSVQLSEENDRSVTVSWTPGNENNSPVFEFVIEVKEDVLSEEGSRMKLERVSAEINKSEIPLLPFCTYRFRVAAVNVFGNSSFSLPSQPYTTPAAKPDQNPKHVKSESKDPDTMIITWEELEQRHFNGPGFRYKVFWRKMSSQHSRWQEDSVSNPPLIINQAGTFNAFEIKVQSANDLGEGPSPVPAIGYSGEDLPLEPPTGIKVIQLDSTTFSVSWTAVSRESVQGHLKGYKIHLHRLGPKGGHVHRSKSRREVSASRVIVVHGDREHKENLTGLEFYSDYQLSVTAFNSKGEGPHSELAHFSTPEGAPSPPSFQKIESPSKDELRLLWRLPHKPNGVLKGYILQYQEILENSPMTLQTVRIDDPTASHMTLSNLNPGSHYFITLRAFTAAGDGEPTRVNATTLFDGVPPTSINVIEGERSLNLSWVPSHLHRNIGFSFQYLRKSAGGQWEESEQVNSSQAFYQLQDLNPGTEYVLRIFFNNDTLWTYDVKTNGSELREVPYTFASQTWFIGLISALVLLLLILLILCFIKRSKGGKYSVKDKEEGRVDSEARPMKDETFGEYSSDNDEKRSISQPSLGMESKHGSDDSLAEYGDSVDIQFNEDGSFIGQYSGRRDHHGQGDHDSSGAVSPNNPNMPPPSMSFPTSVTGILGGK